MGRDRGVAGIVQGDDRSWQCAVRSDALWLFLAVVVDLFRRQIVGWSVRQEMTRVLVIDALRMAWFKRHPRRDAGLIFHSDRGSQEFRRQCVDLPWDGGSRGRARD